MTPIALLFLPTALWADITLPAQAQAPPQADAQTVRVRRGSQTTVPLRAHFGGRGSVSFQIVQRPEHGKLSDLRLYGDNSATITYQNDGAESVTSDGFRYVVKVGGDRTSAAAEVRITVDEAPARLVVPGRLEFGKIMAGERGSRPLSITNEGGGVLEGRLSVSAPWVLALTDYRVKSGETEVVEVGFWPDEAREFVGQITLAGVDGVQTSVQLAGSASAPVRIEPGHLQIDAPKTGSDPRVGSVSLTNQTERALRLKMEADSNIQPIPEFALAPHETKRISVVVLLHREVPLHEEVSFVGNSFRTRLQVDADALPVTPMVAVKEPGLPPPSPRAFASPTPVARIIQAEPIATLPIIASSSPAQSPRPAFVAAQARRLDASRWQLRWGRQKIAAAGYRIEERFLSLDRAGELQTSWRSLASPEIAESGDEVVAQIKGLEPKQLHMLRVSAFGSDGKTLWESPLVALAPPRETPRSERGWLLGFGLVLLVFLFLRWRANRVAA